jgi:hypothetical protein
MMISESVEIEEFRRGQQHVGQMAAGGELLLVILRAAA